MHELLFMLRPFLVVAGIGVILMMLYAVRESREDIAAMSRFWMWVRCALEAALLLFYLWRLPSIVRICLYKLHHETVLYNVQYVFGTALGFGVAALIAWDCHRTWRSLERTKA